MKLKLSNDEPAHQVPPQATTTNQTTDISDVLNGTLFSDSHNLDDPLITSLTKFSEDIISNLIIEWCDQPQDGSVVLFAQHAAKIPVKTTLPPSRFCKDPWVVGSIPRSLSPIATLAIVDWITKVPLSTLARSFFSLCS